MDTCQTIKLFQSEKKPLTHLNFLLLEKFSLLEHKPYTPIGL